MVGTNDNPIQTDEARFAGRRTYDRGRKLNGPNASLSEDSDADARNNRNYGRRIDGSWVFGLKQGSNCLDYYMVRHNRNTLLPIIERECEKSSAIHRDEWPAYSNLNVMGYRHLMVNHQEHYVNPVTGTHMQAIEQSWVDA